MPEQMTKQDAIEYLLYMKHDVQAKSPMDIALDAAIEALKQPTIEPEVRHGRWSVKILDIGDGDKIRMLQCSECSRNANMKSDFCPNCGAKMDGGDLKWMI